MERGRTAQKKASKTVKKKSTPATSKIKKEIEKLKSQTSILQDQLLRKAAEFENYKKRTQREISEIILLANEHLIKDILPVIDDFERSLDAEKNNKSPFYEGIQLILNKLLKILGEKGLKKVEAAGKKFDVEKHEAILQIKSKKHKKDHIVEEYEIGYELNGKVIRYTKVVVSK